MPGKGRHETGQPGSPLVALKTLIEHKHRKTHFADGEIKFFFIEADSANVESLKREVGALGQLPTKIEVEIIEYDCFEALESLVTHLREKDQKLAPAFIFVDPYGFEIPGKILRDIMAFPRVELFVNVIWRELNMEFSHEHKAGAAKTLDSIFDGGNWRSLVPLDHEDRCEGCIDLFRKLTEAQWATRIRMLGKNGVTRYILLHLSNHPAGRELMKDCMWKVCPEGGFLARISDNPDQQLMITPEPDLSPLRKWILEKLAEGPRRWQKLIDDVHQELWRKTHLNKVVRRLRKNGIFEGRDFDGRFAPKNDPELYLLESVH